MKRRYGEGMVGRILERTHVCVRRIAVAIAIGFACAACAEEQKTRAPETTVAPSSPPVERSGWRFDLLPRSFQKHPRVSFNVISEMTDTGRSEHQPSPEQPVYYELHVSGLSDLGIDSDRAGASPDLEYLKQVLNRGLAENGLLPAVPPENPATVFLVCHWGYYSVLDDGDPESHRGWKRKEALDRAALIGGEKFASELAEVLEKTGLYAQAMGVRSHPEVGVLQIVGDMIPSTDFMNPLELFVRRDDKTRHLVEETVRPCYFVVVSAYDRESAMENKRVLLWRTKMTVRADGISMRESMPQLIANTSAFLGKDMSETATIERRINREGKVELGPLQVVGWEEPEPDSRSESSLESNPSEKAAGKPLAPDGR